VLAGEGVAPDNAALAASIEDAGLAGAVSLLGVRPDIDRLMPGLDAFALSSAYGEAFPNVLIEAMASGVPCVATDVGESALILADTGLVVPPRDPGALAAALERLLAADPAERARRGEAARRRVLDHYALTAVADRYLRLYRHVLAERGAGRRRAGNDGDVPACAD
jgi:glycosyltransferase involved in cell wall biosynthesis